MVRICLYKKNPGWGYIKFYEYSGNIVPVKGDLMTIVGYEEEFMVAHIRHHIYDGYAGVDIYLDVCQGPLSQKPSQQQETLFHEKEV